MIRNYHIGCGYTLGKSWINCDNSPIAFFDQIPLLSRLIKINKRKFPDGITYGNIVKKKLCKKDSADNIYCSHVLEHVSYLDAKKMLKNIYEMLKKGGVFRIVVPSLESRIERYQENKDANKFMESLGCVSKSENTNIINKIRFLFGGSRHRWMYDEKSLYEELKIAGFDNIRNCLYGDSGLEIFSEIEDEERFYSNGKTIKEIAFHCIK